MHGGDLSSLEPEPGTTVETVDDESQRRATSIGFWLICLYGFALPWITGAAVKIHLDNLGRPTLPWSYFITSLSFLILIPPTLLWALPYILLALLWKVFLARTRLFRFTYRERLIVLISALTVMSVGTITTFRGVFWEFDFIVLLLAPELALQIAKYLALGLAVGFALAAITSLFRRAVEQY